MTQVYTIKDENGKILKFSICTALELLQCNKLKEKIFSSQDDTTTASQNQSAIGNSNNRSLNIQFIILLLLLLVVGFLNSIVVVLLTIDLFFLITSLGRL